MSTSRYSLVNGVVHHAGQMLGQDQVLQHLQHQEKTTLGLIALLHPSHEMVHELREALAPNAGLMQPRSVVQTFLDCWGLALEKVQGQVAELNRAYRKIDDALDVASKTTDPIAQEMAARLRGQESPWLAEPVRRDEALHERPAQPEIVEKAMLAAGDQAEVR